MSRFARVDSIDHLKVFRASLCKFVEEVHNALAEAETEILRSHGWVRQEQRSFWKAQIRKRAELLNRAKVALLHKREIKTPAGGQYSCIEEKQALALAKRNYAEAEQKMANVKRWIRNFDEEFHAYKGRVQPLARAVESDVPQAYVQLDHVLDALHAYTRLKPPTEDLPGGDESETPSTARTEATPPAAEDHARLRKETPSPEVRDGAFHTDVRSSWLADHVIDTAMLASIAEVETERKPIARDERMVLACSDHVPRRIYLERVASRLPGDSGWFVGFADSTGISGYGALPVSDVLAIRPEWEELLKLPTGTLVVMSDNRVHAVLDADNKVLWPQPKPAWHDEDG